jgi:hypothetical protein
VRHIHDPLSLDRTSREKIREKINKNKNKINTSTHQRQMSTVTPSSPNFKLHSPNSRAKQSKALVNPASAPHPRQLDTAIVLAT